jgi:3-methylfumaryl-CoA hydratase
MTHIDVDHLRTWIGRSDRRSDDLATAPVVALAATLDRDDPPPQAGDPLPLLWHWLYFLPHHRQSDLGQDGHARLGGFLPPVPLPRRMYGGGRIEVLRPLTVGSRATRVMRIADVSLKQARTGPLIVVTLRHEISDNDGLALIEEQDILYREEPRPGDAAPAPSRPDAPADWSRRVDPDPVLLFRYSALTFNGHRIHYDRGFAREHGYPGLVVHGPLIATLLADLLRRHVPDRSVEGFSFRATRPLYDGEPFFVCGSVRAGSTVALWAQAADGTVAMESTAVLRS